MRRRRMFFTVVAALALVAAGCGDDDEAADDGDAPPVYTIRATEPAPNQFKFELPTGMKGGVVTIRLQNDGQVLHDLQLAKAVAGHTLQELLAQVASPDAPLADWVKAAGGVGSTAPGRSNEVTLDLEPGTYWYFDTESSGEDEAPVAHATAGMSGEVAFAGDSGAEFPDTSAKITAEDYSFEMDGLEEGENTVEFVNDGKQIHHALLFPVAAGKTFATAKEALLSEETPEGPPPVDFENGIGTAVIDPGERMAVDMRLGKGTYVVVCFMPDRGTAGPPHATKGMLTELKVS